MLIKFNPGEPNTALAACLRPPTLALSVKDRVALVTVHANSTSVQLPAHARLHQFLHGSNRILKVHALTFF